MSKKPYKIITNIRKQKATKRSATWLDIILWCTIVIFFCFLFLILVPEALQKESEAYDLRIAKYEMREIENITK